MKKSSEEYLGKVAGFRFFWRCVAYQLFGVVLTMLLKDKVGGSSVSDIFIVGIVTLISSSIVYLSEKEIVG